MDKGTAAILLASLLERIDRGEKIGLMTSHERKAIAMATELLQPGPVPAPTVGRELVGTLATVAAPVERDVPDNLTTAHSATGVLTASPDPSFPRPIVVLKRPELNLASLERETPTHPEITLCLDFGTAMSKAFAASVGGEHFALELGATAGGAGFTLPSSVFIGDDGRIYFGAEAVDFSRDLVATSARERLDSIKSRLSYRQSGSLDGEAQRLTSAENPTDVKLTEGDLIRLYLAYLTDMACSSLEQAPTGDANLSRYVRRRFARPCGGTEAQAKWVDQLMATYLAEAQVLADTFHRQWAGGIDAAVLKAALDAVKNLARRPDYLIEKGIPEPVAVASGVVAETVNMRDIFMVVDSGAGTTDFGLFVLVKDKDLENPRIFQVSASIKGLNQAGDNVDGLLLDFIRRRAGYDPTSGQGRLIEVDLRRRIRDLKEVLFRTGSVEYVLADHSNGVVTQTDFEADPNVLKFGALLEKGLTDSLAAIDASWLRLLSMPGVRLHMVLTGGSASLPMVERLKAGLLVIGDHRILRDSMDARPAWLEDESAEFGEVYPQLAVAIGGTSDELPTTQYAPDTFAGGGARTTYVAGNVPLSGA